MATFGRPLLQRFGGFSQTGRADGISPPVGGGRTQPAFPQLRLPQPGGGTTPTTLGRPQAAILGDRQAAFRRPGGPAITPPAGRPGQPLQPTPPAPGIQPPQQQQVSPPPAFGQAIQGQLGGTGFQRVAGPPPLQQAQIQPPAPSQQIQQPARVGIPQPPQGGFAGGFGPGSQFDIRSRLQQQQPGLQAPQQAPGGPPPGTVQGQQVGGPPGGLSGTGFNLIPGIQPPAPFQAPGGAQFGGFQPPGPAIQPPGPQPPGFIGGPNIQPPAPGQPPGPFIQPPAPGQPPGPGVPPGPFIQPPAPGVPGRDFDPTGGGLTLGGNPLIPPGTEAIGLQNLGGLIERQLASPSRFDTAAFQQSFGVGQQELQQQAELARQRATTSAAGRGVLFGTPLTGNLVDIETGLQQAQSQLQSNLLLEQARTGGQDINRAIQTALQFGGQNLGAQQFAAQLGLQQLGLGLQGAPGINEAIGAFGGQQFPQFGGGGGGFGGFAGQLAGLGLGAFGGGFGGFGGSQVPQLPPGFPPIQ